ncbi:hypothetical protein GJ496_006816 [Pomphorhynchus laevis]|nr:hypothetical protein GJ496_006816 [Pomphorhynchus laevis]
MNTDSQSFDLVSGKLSGFIDHSSLDVLRTEILNRKRTLRADHQINSKPFIKKGSSAKRFSSKKSTKSAKFDTSRADEEYERSRQCLLNKAALYDKLSAVDATPLADEDNPFLVDFEKKHFSNIKNAVFSKSGETVEFVDKFGRTRHCERKSLAEFQGLSAPNIYNDEKKSIFANKSTDQTNNPDHDASLEFCNDQYREKLRAKWADDLELISNSADVHYEHIRFNEVRNLGTSYFAFSRDPVERSKQLKRFKDMRKDTLLAQERIVVENLQRQSQLNERLRRVRQNRGISAAIPNNDDDIPLLIADLLNAVEEIVKLRSEIDHQISEAQKAAAKTERSIYYRADDSSYNSRQHSVNNNFLKCIEDSRKLREPEFAPCYKN